MTEMANATEAEFWSGPSGQSWVTHETLQDRLLAEALDAVLMAAGLSSGESVLDIGCGTGALTLAAASAVGTRGRVLATDISAPMLNRAAERASEFAQVATLLADAEVADWPTSDFDVAISRFGVMFFGDPPRAFANIARALRPGGRIAFAAWGPVARNPYWKDPSRIAASHLGDVPKGEPNAPGPMGMADKDWSMEQLRAAGLQDIACDEVEIHLPIQGSVEDAAHLALVIGPAARVVRLFQASEADLAAVHAEIARFLEVFSDGKVVRIPALLHIYTARTA